MNQAHTITNGPFDFCHAYLSTILDTQLHASIWGLARLPPAVDNHIVYKISTILHPTLTIGLAVHGLDHGDCSVFFVVAMLERTGYAFHCE